METPSPAPAEYRELMRRKLADATHRIDWTYAIFWTFRRDQQLLVWGEGYLKGADMGSGLRRSQQLQELFIAINANRALRRPSEIDLGLEKFTPTEWYLMGSMACSFATGAGLPGRAFVKMRPVWQCVTSETDTRLFLRARLAQTARIQTIVCIPAVDGVVEFGATALVEEDIRLLQLMRSVFLEQPMPGITGARERVGGSSSAFNRWTAAPQRQGFLNNHRQRMLKTALLTMPRLCAVKTEYRGEPFPERATSEQYSGEQVRPGNTSGGSSGGKHVIAERKRRLELSIRFETLRSVIPIVTKPAKSTKMTKVTLLEDAIEYVKVLQRQVEKRGSTSKSREEASNQQVEVTVENNMAVLKISCPWRDRLLIDILEKMINIQLEVVDATAKVSNNTLNSTLKAKVRSFDMDKEEKTAEIQAALLHTIEGNLPGKSVIS